MLFEILKDKDDYLDATMRTREIKSRNPKPPTYPIEQNRTKNQSNPIELQTFDCQDHQHAGRRGPNENDDEEPYNLRGTILW